MHESTNYHLLAQGLYQSTRDQSVWCAIPGLFSKDRSLGEYVHDKVIQQSADHFANPVADIQQLPHYFLADYSPFALIYQLIHAHRARVWQADAAHSHTL